jgi:hypothetical protein
LKLAGGALNDESLCFEEIKCEPNFHQNPNDYNNKTHVLTRILCCKDLLVDFNTGILLTLKENDGNII